jgi:hypothetical protein
VPKDDELHMEYFKGLAMKAAKQATHREKRDADDISMVVEDNSPMGHKYAHSAEAHI